MIQKQDENGKKCRQVEGLQIKMRKGKQRRVCEKEIREKGTAQREKDNKKKHQGTEKANRKRAQCGIEGLRNKARAQHTADYERKSGLPKEI